MIRSVVAAVAIVAAAACGADDTMSNDQPDAGGSGDPDGGNTCTKPALDATWLASYVTSITTSIPAPRATTTQRNAARTYLQQQFVQLGLSPQTHSYNSGANIYATVAATGGDARAIIVGAHFDTVTNSPGANDNASGVAAVLAVARYVSEMPCRGR